MVRSGEPIRQILAETTANEYDLAIIGARRKGSGGLYWRPEKTYEVIKAVPPPVLVAIGDCERVQRILVCTGGKKYIDDAVQLAGEIAKCVGGVVTLLHVMAGRPSSMPTSSDCTKTWIGCSPLAPSSGATCAAKRKASKRWG